VTNFFWVALAAALIGAAITWRELFRAPWTDEN
jgi:hypothetical protein